MTTVERRVLIIDDELNIRLMVRFALTTNHYVVTEANTGQQGLAELVAHQPNIVLLDIGLPDMDGFEVLRRLRQFSQVPVIVNTARDVPGDAVAAIEAGATDFLSKPFDLPVLLACLEAILSRADSNTERETILNIGDFRIDMHARRVFDNGVEINLTPIEFQLLEAFVTNTGTLLTNSYLIAEISKSGLVKLPDVAALKAVIASLRQKLKADSTSPPWLLPILGVGYRFLLPLRTWTKAETH